MAKRPTTQKTTEPELDNNDDDVIDLGDGDNTEALPEQEAPKRPRRRARQPAPVVTAEDPADPVDELLDDEVGDGGFSYTDVDLSQAMADLGRVIESPKAKPRLVASLQIVMAENARVTKMQELQSGFLQFLFDVLPTTNQNTRAVKKFTDEYNAAYGNFGYRGHGEEQ